MGGDLPLADRALCIVRLGSRAQLSPQFSAPHSSGDVTLLTAHGLEVNRCCGHAGVTEPSLHEVYGNAAAHGMEAKAMAQSFRSRMRACGNIGIIHDSLDDLPRATAGPRPEAVGAVQSITMDRQQRFQKVSGQRNLANDSDAAPLLEATDGNEPFGDVEGNS